MVDPYKAGMFSFNPYAAKRDVLGRLAVILQGKLDNRSLSLVAPISRAVRRYDIHELIITDEIEAGPGKTVNRISYAGFFEIIAGGVLAAGDEVICSGRVLGRIAGFDETHLPNHLNIVIYSDSRLDGVDLGLGLESEIKFIHKKDGDG
ncbi:MAG: DUF6917 domain-containing protein [Bacillota bacterium]